VCLARYLYAIAVATIAFASVAAADEAAPTTAIVLVKFTMAYVPEIAGRPPAKSMAPYVLLAQYGTDFEFRVFPNASVQHYTVPAGNYYLKRVAVGYANMSSTDKPEPKDTSMTISVPAGAAVYVGDFSFDKAFVFHVDFSKESLIEARDMNQFQSYPLFVSRAGIAPMRLQWE
jgi:hypothetical protein